MASYQCVTAQELVGCTDNDWTDDARLRNALQFANDEEQGLYLDTLSKRVENFKQMANVALEKGEFEKCALWCEKYLQQNESDGSMWQIKLLSVNGARNSSDLYDKCLASVTSVIDSEEYQRVMQCSIPEEAMMFEKTALRIDEAVREKKRVMAYEECRSYMTTALVGMKNRQRTLMANQWKDHQNEAEAMRHLKSNKGSFFSNNVFSFLMQALFWMIPLYLVLAVYAQAMDVADTFLRVFIIVFLAIMGLVLFICLCTYLCTVGRTSRLAKMSLQATAKVENGKYEVVLTNKKTKKAKALLAKYHASPSISVEQIAEFRKEFEALQQNRLD